MTEHAQPIAIRLGLAAGAAAIVVTLFDSGELVWTDTLAAIGFGLITYSGAYIFVYIVEQYLSETGRLTYKHPVDEMKDAFKGVELLVTEGHVDADLNHSLPLMAGNAYGKMGIRADGTPIQVPVDKWRELAVAIRDKGMTHMSKRQLEGYGIVDDRTSEEAESLMWFFVHKELVDDVGNNQYAVTDETKKFLSTFTGVEFNV